MKRFLLFARRDKLWVGEIIICGWEEYFYFFEWRGKLWVGEIVICGWEG